VLTNRYSCVNSHDIYKWHSDQKKQAGRVRSASFAGPSQPPHPAFEHIHEPGGFRRNYLLLRANEQGEEPRILNNFIDFLLLFGHFVSYSIYCVYLRDCFKTYILHRLVKTSKTKTKRTKRMRRLLQDSSLLTLPPDCRTSVRRRPCWVHRMYRDHGQGADAGRIPCRGKGQPRSPKLF
jgi:hypothetical protein